MRPDSTIPTVVNPVYGIIPFPEGTDESYNFSVSHIRSDNGETENPPFEIIAGIGLRVEFTSLSPVAVGYEKPVIVSSLDLSSSKKIQKL